MAALEIGAIEVNGIAMNATAFFAAQETVFSLQFSLLSFLFGEPHVAPTVFLVPIAP